ncbi:AfsR/SARP family transcriptional regulator [Streptomyces beihaiensis]|uniref:BTAD domain-containing putative transcriptional regulator n=1 Tax=Streptomyces beihaiensis TaxID=2984495 RepID=A0ABT3TWG3_9ACTN|nr:BTAD domain-containing putative transcriptional regulator [Streptomyces beihaiensis]MCX3061387.1 BTAD domain-containing putative transcriptional regulator [Streptomyces beihaiensis]
MNTAADARTVTPSAAKVRVVLATLLVRSNEVVSVDGLIDELWGEDPPRTAMTTLQVYVSQLRKLLGDVEPEFGREALLTRPPGYLLRVDPDQLDLAVFEKLHRDGREAMEHGDAAGAADLQRRALALWRGPLLSDTPHGSLLHNMAVRLTEVRNAALEQRMRAELQLGHHQELLGELQSLTDELPMHEEFHAHLMVALYRTGRQADALRTFSKLRRTLVDELAIEPGRRLQQLHSRILTGDVSLLSPSGQRAARRPAAVATASASRAASVDRLPSVDPLFTGREAQIERLVGWLRDLPGGCAQVSGPAGVGKTALAVAAAHRLHDVFPDGRALVSLDSGDGTVLGPTQVLTRVARALGGTGELPHSADELLSLIRASTDGRCVLLILDGVADAAQVRPLLPLASGCAALITCRPALPGLGGHALPLDALSPTDARQLLCAAGQPLAAVPADSPSPRAAGPSGEHQDGEQAEPDVLAGPDALVDERPEDFLSELAELCGRWPAALRGVAAHLATHPHLSPGELAARLRPEATRLDALRESDSTCHRALHDVFDRAPEPVRRAARLLSLLPPEPFTASAAASVLSARPQEAERTLAALTAAGLLSPHPEGRGYHFPVLLRLLAADRRRAEEPALWVRAALSRLSAAAADRAETAQRVARMDGLHPLDWFTRREESLVSLVEQTFEAGLWAQTVRLVDSMTVFFEALAAWEPWRHTHSLALDAAERLGDASARARLLRSLGDLAWQRRRPDDARAFYERALDACGPSATAERGRALAGLADVHLEAGGGEQAARLVTATLEEAPQDVRGCYESRRVLALLAQEARSTGTARRHFQECLALAGVLGDRRLEAYTRRCLDRLDGAAPHPEWAEVRPGVWRAFAVSPVTPPSPGRTSAEATAG